MSRKPKERESNVPGSSSPAFSRWVNQHIEDETKLRMYERKIGAEKAKRIAEELAPNSKLEFVYFSENRIGDEGVLALTGDFATNKTLKTLCLDGNQIGNAGMAALAQFLMRHDSLATLSVCRNDFDNVGLMSLANALQTNKGLKELRLCDNSIDDEGAGILAEALTTNTSLQLLFLSGTRIGDVGATQLLNVLAEVNTTLKELDLRPTPSRAVRSAISLVTGANKRCIRLVRAGATVDLSGKRLLIAEAGLIGSDLAKTPRPIHFL
jgi:Leucine Rich repeat